MKVPRRVHPKAMIFIYLRIRYNTKKNMYLKKKMTKIQEYKSKIWPNTANIRPKYSWIQPNMDEIRLNMAKIWMKHHQNTAKIWLKHEWIILESVPSIVFYRIMQMCGWSGHFYVPAAQQIHAALIFFALWWFVDDDTGLKKAIGYITLSRLPSLKMHACTRYRYDRIRLSLDSSSRQLHVVSKLTKRGHMQLHVLISVY
jgi:hypothetical protein